MRDTHLPEKPRSEILLGKGSWEDTTLVCGITSSSSQHPAGPPNGAKSITAQPGAGQGEQHCPDTLGGDKLTFWREEMDGGLVRDREQQIPASQACCWLLFGAKPASCPAQLLERLLGATSVKSPFLWLCCPSPRVGIPLDRA